MGKAKHKKKSSKRKRRYSDSDSEFSSGSSSSKEDREQRHRKKSRKNDSSSSDESSEDGSTRKKSKKSHRKSRESTSNSSSESSDSERNKKKHHKHKRRHKHKKSKKKKKEKHSPEMLGAGTTGQGNAELRTADLSATVASRTGSFDEEKKVKRRAMAPMTKEDYEKEESRIRQVFDPETGRMRLIRGSGEIVEQIVSRDEQRRINKLATFGDGVSYMKTMGLDPSRH